MPWIAMPHSGSFSSILSTVAASGTSVALVPNRLMDSVSESLSLSSSRSILASDLSVGSAVKGKEPFEVAGGAKAVEDGLILCGRLVGYLKLLCEDDSRSTFLFAAFW